MSAVCYANTLWEIFIVNHLYFTFTAIKIERLHAMLNVDDTLACIQLYAISMLCPFRPPSFFKLLGENFFYHID